MSSRAVTQRSNSVEEALVRRVANGSADAVADLYDRFSGMLLGLATRILKDRGEVEDVLQEVFLQVGRQAGAGFDVAPRTGSAEVRAQGLPADMRAIMVTLEAIGLSEPTPERLPLLYGDESIQVL